MQLSSSLLLLFVAAGMHFKITGKTDIMKFRGQLNLIPCLVSICRSKVDFNPSKKNSVLPAGQEERRQN